MKQAIKSLNKVIVVLGPTAVGKSNFAVRLAKKIRGEVISADSRQVYKGLDIGSGKLTKREMKGVPHHLLDVISPKKYYSVDLFKKDGRKAMKDIWARGKTPIICGGTGFYIDALVDGTVLPDVPANKKLRALLAKKTAEVLFNTLKKLDPARSKAIDPKNKVRLIRAIEIAKALGKVPRVQKTKRDFIVQKIGLALPSAELRKKISIRLFARIREGMIEEVKKLNKNGVSWKRLNAFGLEYRYVALFLRKKITKEEMISKLQTEIWRYAKRQMTWFKRDVEIKWVSPNK